MPIDQRELARRLRSAREDAGLTQDQAASAAGIPRPSIAQIEAGRRAVSGLELDRLASRYGRDLRELLDDGAAAPGTVALFRHDDEITLLPGLREALEECLLFGRELAELERSTGADRATPGAMRYDLTPPASVATAVEQAERAADAERRRLGLFDAPIGDLIDLLEGGGVRTAIIDMPDSISGLMVAEPGTAPLVVANRTQHIGRRTFSFAHEYAHVLFDRDFKGLVSRAGSGDLLEVRANAFAAAFLMPEAGIKRRLAEFGKPTPGAGSPAPGRAAPVGADEGAVVKLHDAAVLAHEFKVTRVAMLYRLHTIRVLTRKRADALREEDAASGAALAKLLGLAEPDHAGERERSRTRFSRLALEAHARGLLDAAGLRDRLARHVGADAADAAMGIATRRRSP